MSFTELNNASSQKSRLNSGVVTLGWVSLLTDFSSDMIYPLLPDFLTARLGAGPAVLGLIEGIAEATASLTRLLSGWWADRTRRRKPLVVLGYSIAAAARPLIGLASGWPQVLAIRFADRLGKGIRTAPRDALIASLAAPGELGRAFGLQRAMDNAGAVAGPLAAALLLHTILPDERHVFLLAFAPGLLAVVLLVRRVSEAPDSRAAAGPAADETTDRMPRGFWVATGLFVLFTLANSTDAFLLLRARDSGIPLWQIPLLWAFFHAAKAVGGVPGGALSDRIGRVACVGLGWLVYVAAYAGFAFVSTPAGVWGLFFLYAFFFALTEGAERALVADLVGDRLRGRAFGIFHGAIGFAALPSSILFGIWWKVFGARAAFLIGAGLALLSAAGLFAARRSVSATAAAR